MACPSEVVDSAAGEKQARLKAELPNLESSDMQELILIRNEKLKELLASGWQKEMLCF